MCGSLKESRLQILGTIFFGIELAYANLAVYFIISFQYAVPFRRLTRDARSDSLRVRYCPPRTQSESDFYFFPKTSKVSPKSLNYPQKHMNYPCFRFPLKNMI